MLLRNYDILLHVLLLLQSGVSLLRQCIIPCHGSEDAQDQQPGKCLHEIQPHPEQRIQAQNASNAPMESHRCYTTSPIFWEALQKGTQSYGHRHKGRQLAPGAALTRGMHGTLHRLLLKVLTGQTPVGGKAEPISGTYNGTSLTKTHRDCNSLSCNATDLKVSPHR